MYICVVRPSDLIDVKVVHLSLNPRNHPAPCISAPTPQALTSQLSIISPSKPIQFSHTPIAYSQSLLSNPSFPLKMSERPSHRRRASTLDNSTDNSSSTNNTTSPNGVRTVKPLQSSNPKTQYLIIYNFISCILWLIVLGRVLFLIPLVGFGRVYSGVGQFTKWTQTLALLEVVHALFGR